MEELPADTDFFRAGIDQIWHPGRKLTVDHVISSETSRSKWKSEPTTWAKDRAGVELWSKQREILTAVRDNRRVAVHSCHSTGKTYNAAVVTSWWIDSHPPGSAFVVTTAPTGAQVKAQLWREINRLHTSAHLDGRVNLTEWYLNNEMVAFGRKPSEYNNSAFQGQHARYVLVILDEACGIPTVLWVAAESIASNKHSRVLAIGNPDVNDGDFARVCKPDSGWKTIHVSWEHVRDDRDMSDELREVLVSEEWVESCRQSWGESSALFQSKCLGQFPADGHDPWIVAPLSMVTPCRYLELPHEPEVAREAGIDVGAGGDRTVIVERVGNVAGRHEEFRNPDPMTTIGQLVARINEWGIQRVKIDIIGVGWGIYGRLRELSSKHNPTGETTHDAEVVAVDFRTKSSMPKRFLNLRAEVWWNVGRERSRLQTWDLGSLSDDVVAELTAPKYEIIDSTGKIKIESKDEVIKRLGRSPDIADALLIAFYDGATPSQVSTSAVNQFKKASLMSGPNGRGASPFRHTVPSRSPFAVR